MATLSRRSAYRPRPAMNVTPLVDVVLVLLIIFMVVIPALEQGVTLELPGMLNVDDDDRATMDPFLVTLLRDGSFMFAEDPVAESALERVLRAARVREPARRLVVRADGGVAYGAVRRVYKLTQELGFPGVSLRVNQRHDATREDGGRAAIEGGSATPHAIARR